MKRDNNNTATSTENMFSYLSRVQRYMKKYAENCRYSFNSMLSI
ncbi:hypothetical protein R3X28_17430 [Maribacter sp. TH_r10]|nr:MULTISPECIES: hypothetical protein [Maribacter]MDV7140678.1 hypothetical protein [Maribacter sp. TH_r10]